METHETTQNQFTDDEKQLAERYQVEPKLCRLISEIVSERAETTEQPEPEAKKIRTGNEALDELIESASYEGTALAHGCLELYAADQSLGEKIREKLDSIFEDILLSQGKSGSDLDLECDVLPAIKWGKFLQGYMSGRGLVRI